MFANLKRPQTSAAIYTHYYGNLWDGMTNYKHALCTGHMVYFLLTNGNLYRYSQQGWEALNCRLKFFTSLNVEAEKEIQGN